MHCRLEEVVVYWKTLCWSQSDFYCREAQRVRTGGPFQPQIPEFRSSQGCELQTQDVSSIHTAGGPRLVQWWLLDFLLEISWKSQWHHNGWQAPSHCPGGWWGTKSPMGPSPALFLASTIFCISLLWHPPRLPMVMPRCVNWESCVNTAPGPHSKETSVGMAFGSDSWGDPNGVPKSPWWWWDGRMGGQVPSQPRDCRGSLRIHLVAVD